jgi:hypothetical protein
MALFARRYMQRILDDNAAFLAPAQLRTAVGLLNSVSRLQEAVAAYREALKEYTQQRVPQAYPARETFT